MRAGLKINRVGCASCSVRWTSNRRPETSSSEVCGALEHTGGGAELGTVELVGADLGEVRNIITHLHCGGSKQRNLGAVFGPSFQMSQI